VDGNGPGLNNEANPIRGEETQFFLKITDEAQVHLRECDRCWGPGP